MEIPLNLGRGTGLKSMQNKVRSIFPQGLAYSKDLPSIRKKKFKIYDIKELKNRSIPSPPSPYRQHDGDKCDRRRSDLGIGSMDKLNNLRARENYHCLQYRISLHLEKIHLEICLEGRCSYCPMKELEQKA